MSELGKRSHVSRGGRLVAGIALSLLGTGAVFYTDELGAAAWVFFGIATIGLLVLTAWKAKDRDELEMEDLIEVARQSIRTEAERLDRKRLELDKILMAYGEWMEFPDYEELREIDWAIPQKSVRDAKVAELLETEADLMIERFTAGNYWDGGQFQTRVLLIDLFNFVENIAMIYQPEAKKPVLETNLESFCKAINRASLQVILLLEELPLIEAKELNLRKVADGARKAGKVYRKYEELSPYLEPVRYLWQGSKLLLASNPLLAAGWIAGSELLWKGGKKYGKKAIDAYILSLVRQTLGIIAWETASIYDRNHRYRNPDFVYGVELAHLVSQFELTRDALRGALKELGTIPLRSSYDRIFLYRCVAQHASPKPERFAQADLLTEETRAQVVERLEAFFRKHAEETTDRAARKWRKGVKKRLGVDGDPG